MIKTGNKSKRTHMTRLQGHDCTIDVKVAGTIPTRMFIAFSPDGTAYLVPLATVMSWADDR